ncbi:uncharacterized protein CIMG_03516 [Coccidioides immitis RS]|uniref:TLC domain-containing protein n=4 Tax=Coccidioides immitis TaxID=5501 RepID=J3KBI8_COCIM|nr:uncharacterized protein CIMG_03516 [Coccidioides immitis RS]KMP07729.1 DUF887 domain containing protein [Coccidioides immitis RMSCC 2394]KMU71816.1 hypothetical protein CISG_00126 [Coccidioides immitis RMSCC 3703]KMU82817.1 DUF887 domain-containing protein [Coccidioides immitis H538.4]TPX25258.1 hypothetical protein DIZ76_010709 [Coccidioides immitis]EAS32492.3 hypothetical protein CIMG_03516 [Coccidioides immitis RS]
MLDPIPPPPEWLQNLVRPFAEYVSLPSLQYHIHEVLAAFVFYQFVQSVISPALSSWLFPKIYPNFPRRTKLNWDVHVVSLVQSSLINAVALWVMFVDEERKSMSAAERVYGYSGSCALIQAMATGYFLWDLIVSTLHVRIFGIGLLFHAISALWVFSLGFRPFVNYYSPVFILYELSSPFLNFHWFFDKVNMTGSRAQWYNGMVLLSVFFSCRLVWGTYQSVKVFADIFNALSQTRASSTLREPFNIYTMVFQARNTTLCIDESCIKANNEISKFASHQESGIPLWLVLTYLSSNLVLNSLNFYWFSKMIEAVTKRFKTAADGKAKKEISSPITEKEAEAMVLDAAAMLEEKERVFINGGMEEDGSEDKKQGITASAESQNRAPGVRRRKA